MISMEQIPLLPSCRRKVSVTVPGKIGFGSIPTWLKGYLIRYGSSGSHNHGRASFSEDCHYTSGAGLLQKFEFKKGQVLYTSRWIQTEDSELREEDDSRRAYHVMTTVSIPDPCDVIFKRLSSTFSNPMHKENINTGTASLSVYPVGDQVFIVEAKGLAHRIELENLGTTMKVNLLEKFGLLLSTHPQIFESPDTIYTVGLKLDVFKRPQYVVTEMSAKSNQPGLSPWSNAKIVATVPSRWLTKVSYMHSFAVTKNYFIIIEQPVCQFHPEVVLNLTHHSNKMASSLYYPKKNTLFHLISRDGTGHRKIYSCAALFFMHTINAFENWQGDVFVDVCCYGNPKCVKALCTKKTQTSLADDLEFAKSFCSRPYRFNLLHKVREEEGTAPAYKELLVDFGCELPRINEKYRTHMYNYFYGIASDISGSQAGSLVKVNVELGAVKVWRESVVRSCASEPIFIPNPGGIEEDDGILLATLFHGNLPDLNITSVAILDAGKLELLARIDFNLDTNVPNCSHGWFFPQKTDDKVST